MQQLSFDELLEYYFFKKISGKTVMVRLVDSFRTNKGFKMCYTRWYEIVSADEDVVGLVLQDGTKAAIRKDFQCLYEVKDKDDMSQVEINTNLNMSVTTHHY